MSNVLVCATNCDLCPSREADRVGGGEGRGSKLLSMSGVHSDGVSSDREAECEGGGEGRRSRLPSMSDRHGDGTR